MLRKTVILLVAYGIILHFYSSFFKGEGGGVPTLFIILVFLLGSLPYIICFGFIKLTNKPHIALGGLILPIVLDSYIYYDVFVNPSTSTSSLGFLFGPLANIILFMPIGIIISMAAVYAYNKNK